MSNGVDRLTKTQILSTQDACLTLKFRPTARAASLSSQVHLLLVAEKGRKILPTLNQSGNFQKLASIFVPTGMNVLGTQKTSCITEIATSTPPALDLDPANSSATIGFTTLMLVTTTILGNRMILLFLHTMALTNKEVFVASKT